MAEFNVPVPYATIAAAIAAASPGDTIVIDSTFSSPETNLDVLVDKEGLTFDVAAGLGNVSLILQGTIVGATLTGGGNFSLFGQGGGSGLANTLTGNGGDNFLRGRGGADTLDGGGQSGRGDWADYRDSTGSVTVTLTNAITPGGPTGGTSSGFSGADTLINIENIRGSDNHADILNGNSGDNWLRGQGGSDTLNGGSHGSGGDWADYAGSGTAVTATLSYGGAGTGVQGADTDTFISIENLSGSNVADTLTGNAGANWFRGNAGDDIINGAEAGDWIDYAGAGGSVTVTLTDVTNGSGWLTGSGSGADGNDTLYNIENIRGSDFNDVLTGNSLGNFLRGRKGDDTLDGGAGGDWADYFNASAGVIVTLADSGSGTATGADGNDTLISIENVQGSQYADTLIGNATNNAFRGRDGDDVINGLGGTGDMVDYQKASAGITVVFSDDLEGAPGAIATGVGEGTDTLRGIEVIRGSAFIDTMTGASGNEFFRGLLGNDILNGGGNTASGAAGTGGDWADYRHATGSVFVTLTDLLAGHTGGSSSGAEGDDTLIDIENIMGSNFGDTLTGNDENNTLKGLGGSDTMYGMGGNDAIIADTADFVDAGAGDDTVKLYGSAEFLDGGEGYDTLILYGNIDLPAGGFTTGFEKIRVQDGFAGNFDDVVQTNGVVLVASSLAGGGSEVYGSAFNDRIIGQHGEDIIEGAAGNDIMSGGGGADTFLYRSATFGQDRIYDFQDGSDLLDFSSVAEVDDVTDFIVSQSGSHVKVATVADPNQWILISNLTAANITNDDFIFGGPGL